MLSCWERTLGVLFLKERRALKVSEVFIGDERVCELELGERGCQVEKIPDMKYGGESPLSGTEFVLGT